MNKYSHIDLTVNSWEKVRDFYEHLLPALGFTRTFHSRDWKVFAAEGELPSCPYFTITEKADHRPNDNLIGFWAENREEVDRIADIVKQHGGTIEDGPRLFPISPTNYAEFFRDPCGNLFEMLHRLN